MLIAIRAKRSEDHPDESLEIGEAEIGDYVSYGVTRQIYRDDISYLKSNHQITTKGTSRGTIAMLISSDIFDINEEKRTTTFPKKEPTKNHQRTTNKNDKNDKKIIKENNKRKFGPEELTPEIIKELADKYRVSVSSVETLKEKMLLKCESDGKPYINYKAALSRWILQAIEWGQLKQLPVQNNGGLMAIINKHNDTQGDN